MLKKNARLCFYQTRSAWSRDQWSNKNHSPAYNFTPTVTKFCVMWEGLSLPHDTKFGNCRCKIVDSRVFPIWSLIHGSSWSGLIKAEPGWPVIRDAITVMWHCSNVYSFQLCGLEMWWIIFKNNWKPLLCHPKLCASFRSHQWIKSRVMVWKIGEKFILTSVALTFDLWPWPFVWTSLCQW